MRPVDKGDSPIVAYARYCDASGDLIARLGQFCSYCERQIETHLAVEHVQPKARVVSLRTSWSNFLLGCVNCNSCKGSKQITITDYYWPDCDNTLRAFDYTIGGLVTARSSLDTAAQAKAKVTISLTGLDRFPGSPAGEPTKVDRRWLRRKEVWELAERCAKWLTSNDSVEVRNLIVESALGRGMFSIWWTVFANDIDLRRRLRQAFAGTDAASFDALENAVARPGGQL